MGFLDTLFGGSKSSSNPKDVTAPEIKALRSPFAITANRLTGADTGGGLSGIPAPTGPFSAPMAPGEQTALSQLGQFTANNPLQTASTDYLTKALGGNFLPGQPGANPFLGASIDAASRPILQGLQDLLSRELPGRFTQAGQFVNPRGSSPFDFAAARATGDVANALGDIGTRLAFQTQEAERGRQQEAVGQSTQLNQQQVQTMLTNLQAQALPRLIEDLGLERGQEIFKVRMQALLQALGVITNAPLQTEATSTSSKTKGGIIPALFQ